MTDTVEPVTQAGPFAAAGAITTGLVGGVIGAAAALLIPGFGLAIAGGIIATTIGGAAIGAAAGGLIGALMGMDITEEEAHHYEHHFKSGRILVIVKAGD